MLQLLAGRQIFVVGAARTPIGAFNGALKHHKATDLGASALKAALERSRVPADTVDEVILGNVVTAGSGQNPAKQAAIKAGLPHTVHSMLVNTVCSAGMAAVVEAVRAVLAGASRVIAAGGMESRTNAPYLLMPFDRRGRRIAGEQRGDNFALALPGAGATIEEHWAFVKSLRAAVVKEANTFEALVCPFHQGTSMKDYAMRYAAGRGWTAEFVNRYADASFEKAERARDSGKFADEIAAVGDVKDDEIASKELQKTLRDKSDAPVSAYNAPSLADGAAAVLLADGRRMRELRLEPMARVLGFARIDVPPDEFIEAPAKVANLLIEALAASGAAGKLDILEGNESFGVQIPIFEEAVPIERQNVHGGAVALRHPLGCSGARIIVTLLHAMKRYDLKRGLATICFASGGAFAMAFERCT